MKALDMLRELEAIALKKQILVSYDSIGDVGSGGLCKVKGQYRIIVDKRAADGDKVTVLAQSLASFPLDDVFISEEIRRLIDKHRKPQSPAA